MAKKKRDAEAKAAADKKSGAPKKVVDAIAGLAKNAEKLGEGIAELMPKGQKRPHDRLLYARDYMASVIKQFELIIKDLRK